MSHQGNLHFLLWAESLSLLGRYFPYSAIGDALEKTEKHWNPSLSKATHN
jgi:hypothetical protein